MSLASALARPHNEGSPERVKRLDAADRMTDLAWGVAVLWAVVRATAAIWLVRVSDAGEWTWFLDPALILALAYGLYRRSRACAVILLLYVVLELRRAYHIDERPAGIVPAILLGFSFILGIRGTFTHRRERLSAEE